MKTMGYDGKLIEVYHRETMTSYHYLDIGPLSALLSAYFLNVGKILDIHDKNIVLEMLKKIDLYSYSGVKNLYKKILKKEDIKDAFIRKGKIMSTLKGFTVFINESPVYASKEDFTTDKDYLYYKGFRIGGNNVNVKDFVDKMISEIECSNIYMCETAYLIIKINLFV